MTITLSLRFPDVLEESGLLCGVMILVKFIFRKGYKVFFKLLELFWGSTGPGRYLIFFLVKFHVECRQNHVWGPPGARVMSIFVKTYIFGKVELR